MGVVFPLLLLKGRMREALPVKALRRTNAAMDKRGSLMKKLALATAAVLTLLSVAGCAQYMGKGKAPPPVVTKG